MLGCQDFCGFYDWTFHYLRREFGEAAVKKYWREAIAEDSQHHYIEAGQACGLAGLYDCWNTTGIDEQCDWTVELSAAENLLQINMTQCPSKGFLLDNDLNADEDYCNHCMGWIGPALEKVAARVAAHEHNHCGQCFWQIVPASSPPEVSLPQASIRKHPLWESGYLHRFENHAPVAEAAENSFPDSVAMIRSQFVEGEDILLIGDSFDATSLEELESRTTASIVSGRAAVKFTATNCIPRIVLLGYDDLDWVLLATALATASSGAEPLLVHPYLPSVPPLPFDRLGLPRPLPLLPTLIRAGIYTHQPHGPTPSTNDWIIMLGQALGSSSQRLGLD